GRTPIPPRPRRSATTAGSHQPSGAAETPGRRAATYRAGHATPCCRSRGAAGRSCAGNASGVAKSQVRPDARVQNAIIRHCSGSGEARHDEPALPGSETRTLDALRDRTRSASVVAQGLQQRGRLPLPAIRVDVATTACCVDLAGRRVPDNRFGAGQASNAAGKSLMSDVHGVALSLGRPPRRFPLIVIAIWLACAAPEAPAGAAADGGTVPVSASRHAGVQPATPGSTAGPPASTTAVTLGEVIVTANPRREPSREVPMHVDTLSAARLQEVGARTLADYASYQPGVFFASQGGPGEGTLIMRGVSTGNQTSPTVAVYVDDVPIGGSTLYSAAATYVFDAAMMDLDHLEFLFGPQGTLYGAGSMGGLVKYVTRKPDPGAFSGSAGLDVSHGQRGGIDTGEHLTLNMPLVKDVAALRVSAVDQHTIGVYRAVGETPSTHADSNRTRGVRLQLQVYPTSRLSFDVSAMAQRIAADGLSMSDYSLAGQALSGGPYNRRLNQREPFTQTLQLYVFRAGYDLDWASLDWISSYQTFVNRAVQDYPDVFLGLLNQLGPAFGVDQKLDSLYVDSTYDVHKAAQEIRLTSKHNDDVDWLAGIWFSREDAWENFALQGTNQPPPEGQTRLLRQDVSSRFQEYAGYGDATWHLSPVVNLTFGARLSGNTQTLGNFEDGPVAGSPGGFREHLVSDNITKMLTASYRPDTTRSWYVRASTGYRPGGLQAPVTSTIFGASDNITNHFGSDTLASYEAGFKGRFPDGDLSIGADVYDIEWHNLQVPTYTVGNAVIVNVGDARIH